MKGNEQREKVRGKELRYFCGLSVILLFVAAFLFASPTEIAIGMKKIVLSRDALITDYFELAGYGAAFFNAGVVMLLSMILLEAVKIPYTGITLGVLFIGAGFGFWGKNPVNTIPIILGTWLYARIHHAPLARYIYTALFSTCLAPFVTEMAYLLPLPSVLSLFFAILFGVFVGFVMPPLAMHTASMHMGYNLFNVGFAGGTLAFVIFCILKSFGVESQSVLIWKAEQHPMIVIGLFLYFLVAFLFGLWIEHGNVKLFVKIMRHPGRAVADFVMMDGTGATLMNMGIMGMLAETYILLIGGDMAGPILGCLLTVFGFSAFGAHPRNYLPVLLGVFLASWLNVYEINSPGILIAAMFVVGLSPIAGQYGVIPGVLAGMLHVAIVMCTAQMYGGLNLYNNGFSAGWVAIIMVPVIESFMHQYESRKKRKRAKQSSDSASKS